MTPEQEILEEVRKVLRIECEEVGRNDWPDDLHPADVIEKYLCRGWRQRWEKACRRPNGK